MASIAINKINNVFNIGGGTTSCDAGTQYCSEGYGLYFPCLKDITRGQSLCFEFYVTDTANQDVADLRDVDDISLELSGLYGCTYGTYTYPDDISSLQTEEYHLVYENDFTQKGLCTLNLIALDIEETEEDPELRGESGYFYSGSEVVISAYDTPTHIFVGWANLTTDDECDEETWDDYIFNKNNVISFVIESDRTILALYRPRKTYSVVVNPKNVSSHYIVTYNDINYHISHRHEDICNNEYEHLDVLEGYHIIAECVPNISEIGDSDDYTYEFSHWKDGNTDRCRIMCVGTDTVPFENDNVISLYAECTGPVELYNIEKSNLSYYDEFDENGIHIITKFDENIICEYTGDEYTNYVENVNIEYISEEGVLHFNYGTLVMSSMDIDGGIKINLYAKADEEECELVVTVNDIESTLIVTTDDYKLYEFYFRNCEQSNIAIKVNGKCYVDLISIYKEEIIDKGKAQLCLDSETTSNLPTGPLYVSGAIMVNGQSFGLSKVQIGNINKLSKIILNQ